MTESRTRRIEVDYLARVEGEGAMKVVVDAGEISEVEFRIFEPPRFFEAFLEGRPHTEAPDITARICGICPIAYQMSAVHAMENALDITVDAELRALRRLIYCGEWIESHALHVYLLHAPDFLGYQSAVHMAADHKEMVEKGLQLKKAGNDLVALLGGREIHPINVKVGGFYRAPSESELIALVPQLEAAAELAKETVEWVAGFEYPDIEREVEFVSLSHPDEYPFNEGRIVSDAGLDIGVAEYEQVFEEEHVARSNALHSRIRERGSYQVGPVARYNLNFEKLGAAAQAAAEAAGIGERVTNPFRSIAVRGIELVHACEEALQIIAAYRKPDKSSVPYQVHAGRGFGATEAPRGLLYHRYDLAEDGRISTAQIIPPTSQNQLSIEEELWTVLGAHIDLPDDELSWVLEQSIRNYDPCISCATHFLDLTVERR